MEEFLFPPLPRRVKVPFSIPYWNLPKIIGIIFEKNLEAKTKELLSSIGLNNTCLVDSGTSGLFLILKEIGITKGDEIILPSFVCKSVSNTILSAKGTPVLVDIDDDFNISPKSVSKSITKNTKAVIAVHQYGKMCKIQKLRSICKSNGIILIEDSAVPIGIKYKERFVGTFGDYSLVSFNMGKTIVSFGGGLVNCNIKKSFDCRSVLRGRIKNILFFLTNIYYKRFFINAYSLLIKLGIKKRLENICELYENINKSEVTIVPRKINRLQLATTLFQLRNIKRILSKQARIAEIYRKKLSNIKEITLPINNAHSFTYFPIAVKNRYRLAKWLSENGIETQWTFYPLHLQTKFAKYAKGIILKNTDQLWKKELSLPIHAKMTVEQAEFVCKKIGEFYKNGKVSG